MWHCAVLWVWSASDSSHYIVMQAMAAILNHPRVYSFLHVPVQSGSDQVLTDMKREYTVQDFTQLIDYLRDR